MNILIVDDDPMVARLLYRHLSSNGFDVAIAHTFSDARRTITERRTDAVLLDGNLPDGKGWDLTRDLCESYQGISVIGMSGEAREEEFLAAGARMFIRKPFPLDELNSLLDDCLRQGSHRASGERNEM